MEEKVSRRDALRAGAVGVAGSLAGCSDLVDGWNNAASDQPAEWPMFGNDAANTGHTAAPGPTADITTRWSVETDNLTSPWSPAVVDGTVYVGWGSAVAALDADSGDRDWRTEVGVPTAPAVVDDTVYVGGGASERGAVYALDAGTGETEWQVSAGDYFTSSPTVVDGTVYIGNRDGRVFALNAETGEERWRYAFERLVIATPAVADGSLYVGNAFPLEDGEPRLVALDADTGSERWAVELGTMTASASVVDGTVYVVDEDGRVHALSAADGDRQWGVERDDVGRDTQAVADGTVYVPGRPLSAYHAETGEETWRRQDIAVETSPAVTSDTVYVSGKAGSVHALAADSGEERWQFEVADLPKHGYMWGGSSPAITDGTVYVAGVTGTVYALEEA